MASAIDNLTINIEKFVLSYLATAAWVTVEDSNECSDFTKEAKIIAEKDCKAFILLVIAKFGTDKANELLSTPGSDLDYLAPHDFFLTRNHHGAGFWDKPDYYGQNEADQLTTIAQSFKESNCTHLRGTKSKLIFE